jgi:hypothetical protein
LYNKVLELLGYRRARYYDLAGDDRLSEAARRFYRAMGKELENLLKEIKENEEK